MAYKLNVTEHADELFAICYQTKYNEEKEEAISMARTANVFARVEPLAYRTLTKEQFDAEIEKGMEDIKAGRVYSADEVEAEMKREFGI